MDLLRLRTLKGYTQTQMAVLVGCSLTSYRLWEQGVTTPSEESQEKLKKILGTDESEE